MLKRTMIISFTSSILAELTCLTLYYPFDLIKTRMQATTRSLHSYNGVLDAFFKIYNEPQQLSMDNRRQWIEKALRMKGFYTGMFYYALSYTSFVAV